MKQINKVEIKQGRRQGSVLVNGVQAQGLISYEVRKTSPNDELELVLRLAVDELSMSTTTEGLR